MLKQEQAAELLARCENVTGVRLEQVRGNLRNAESRSAAVWELLVLEEAARHGDVEYEAGEGGSPDIKLTLTNGAVIWIEVAFLYPRFWKEERATDTVMEWIRDEATRQGISLFKIGFNFDGDRTNRSGPVRKLPALHQRKAFLLSSDVKRFFATIHENPSRSVSILHQQYTVEFHYDPNGEGPYIVSNALVQEVPSSVKQHAVYRILKEKARQHKLIGKRVVCVGSDQSPVMPRKFEMNAVRPENAVGAAFRESTSLSAAILVTISDQFGVLQRPTKIAEAMIYQNPNAKVELEKFDLNCLLAFNFNRWSYSWRLGKYEPNQLLRETCMRGDLKMGFSHTSITVEVPSTVLTQALSGQTSLGDYYRINETEAPIKQLREGWRIVGCSYKPEAIEQGKSSVVVLELCPPTERVYWPD